MTVTKGKKKYSFPVSSAQNSDVESLHLGSASTSDTESLNNEPVHNVRPFVPPILKSTKKEEQLSLKRNSGRKKLRRYQNRYSLHTLAEEEEEDEGALIVIMEPYQSPFSKLLEDKDALEYWNTFIDKSEEEQAEVIQAFSHRNEIHFNKTTKQRSSARISSKIKRTIKIQRNLSLEHVKESEDDLIEFFKKTPDQIYIKRPPTTYFERLLLHAIAQYHGLHSLGILEDGQKKIEIYNSNKDWIPADCFLTDFVAQLRK